MIMAKENSTAEKSWTVETLRIALEKSNVRKGVPADLELTSEILWRHLPLELLPILPTLPLKWGHVNRKLSNDDIMAILKDPWGGSSKELHVKIINKDLDIEVSIVVGKATPTVVENLHQALYLLTN